MIDLKPFDSELRAKGSDILFQYNKAIVDEEMLLFQKARIEWLKDGDRNSAFFHKIIKGRLHRSRIMSICNESGTRFEGDDVAPQFVEHFTNFLGNNRSVQNIIDPDNLFVKKVSSEEALKMILEETDDEIKEAMFDIADN